MKKHILYNYFWGIFWRPFKYFKTHRFDNYKINIFLKPLFFLMISSVLWLFFRKRWLWNHLFLSLHNEKELNQVNNNSFERIDNILNLCLSKIGFEFRQNCKTYGSLHFFLDVLISIKILKLTDNTICQPHITKLIC